MAPKTPPQSPLAATPPAPDRASRAGVWLLAAALFALPLFFLTGTKDQFELPKQVLLRCATSLLAGILLAGALSKGEFRWRRGPLDWPVLAWCVWLLATTLHSVAPAVSWRGEYENFAGSLTQLNYAALYFLAVQFADTPRKAALAARAVLLAAMGAALYALMQALQRDLIAWVDVSVVADRFFGSMGNPNFLGGLMAMAIVLKLALARNEASKAEPKDPESWGRLALVALWVLAYLYQGKAEMLDPFWPRAQSSLPAAAALGLWLASLAAAPLLRRLGRPRTAYLCSQAADLLLMFQALAGTATRGAFLGLLAGVSVLVLGWLKPDAGPSRRALAKAAATIGLIAFLIAGAFIGLGTAFRQRTLESLRDPLAALEVSRLEIWGPAVKIWKAHPIAGTGVDSFKTVFPAYSKSRFNKYDGENVSSRMAHCEPLQILSTQGAVGLALWFWLCGAAALVWWRKRRACEDPGDGALLLGLGALGAAYLAQNLVSFGVAGISAPAWAALGLLACTAGPGPARKIPPTGSGPAWILGLLLAGAGCWLALGTARADIDYAYACEIHSEIQELDKASLDDLHGAIGFALYDLDGDRDGLSPTLSEELRICRGSLEEAEDRLRQDPASAQALAPGYLRLAQDLLAVAAAARCERAVRACPSEVKYQVYEGLCYEELLRRTVDQRRQAWFDAAAAAYARSVELNPGNAYYRGNLGRLWGMAAGSGDAAALERAEGYYREAIARAPATRLFYGNLLLLEAQNAQVGPAQELLTVLEKSDQELAPEMLLESATTFMQARAGGSPAWTPQAKAEALQAAREWARRAVDLSPLNAEAALDLAALNAEAGDRQEAGRWARRCLALDPGNERALRLIKDRRL